MRFAASLFRIAGDFIKTELARFKRDIFSVFSSTEPAQLLHQEAPGERQHILNALLQLFINKPGQPQTVETALELCETEYARNRRFNFRTSGSTGEPVDCTKPCNSAG